MKLILSITGVALAIVILVFLFVPGDSQNSSTQNSSTNNSSPGSTGPITGKTELYIGSPEAKASIIEYGDFKCPSCNVFHHQAAVEIRENYVDTNQANIIFRNLPFIGPDSQRAAEGSYCANDQGKFTEYHDEVYNYMWDNYYINGNLSAEFEDILTVEVLSQIASEIGMNSRPFEDCLNNRDHESAVTADLEAAQKDGASGTPAFVVADQTITGPQPYNIFKTLIDIQLR